MRTDGTKFCEHQFPNVTKFFETPAVEFGDIMIHKSQKM